MIDCGHFVYWTEFEVIFVFSVPLSPGLKFFFFFFLDWAQKCRLNLGKIKFGLFFLLGHELGPIPKRGPAGAGPGPGKKPGILNGPGPGYGSCPAGRARIWKNPARTRPVAIPKWW